MLFKPDIQLDFNFIERYTGVILHKGSQTVIITALVKANLVI